MSNIVAKGTTALIALLLSSCSSAVRDPSPEPIKEYVDIVDRPFSMSSFGSVFVVQGTADGTVSVVPGFVDVRVKNLRITCTTNWCKDGREVEKVRVGLARASSKRNWKVVTLIAGYTVDRKMVFQESLNLPSDKAFRIPFKSIEDLRRQRLLIAIEVVTSNGESVTTYIQGPDGLFADAK